MPSRDRCDFTGCARFARPGTTRCSRHRDAIDRHGDPPTTFEASIEAGEYAGLFGSLAPQIAQAAHESGIESEIGVLRLVMARLLAEEADPAKLASGVAKLASVVIQAQRAQRALSGKAADDLTDAVAVILEELAP